MESCAVVKFEPSSYLRHCLASGEGIVLLGVRHAVCVSAALVSVAKVSQFQCSLIYYLHQVNGVLTEIMCSFDVCLCVCAVDRSVRQV